MLDIRIEGESADLTPTTSLTLEQFNPLLDFEAIQGSRSYGFDLPDTPTNRRLLGYFYQPQVGYQHRKFLCDHYLHSQLIDQGYLMQHEVKPEGFSLYFTQNLGEIFGDRQKPTLSQLALGTDVIAPVATINHLTARYCFPSIKNADFYGNQAIAGFNGIVNEYSIGTYNSVAQVPIPFLRWIFSQFGTLTGWSFVGQFWQDPDLARLLIYNLFSLDEQASINSNNLLPSMTMPQLILELRRLFNLYLEFDVRRKICTMDFAEDVLASNDVVDWTDKADPKHANTPDLANRIELGYVIDSNDGLLKPIPPAMDIYTTPETTLNEGGTVVPIRSSFSTLLTHSADSASGVAMTAQTGISPNNKDNKNDSTPKLLFYNVVVGGIPTATNTCGTRSLLWHGPNNLVDKGYRHFEGFKGDTFSITKLVMLSASDMALFSFRRKVHIKGVNYVVGSLKSALTVGQKVVPTEAVL